MLLPKVIRGMPSALTLTSLCLGLWSILFSMNEQLLPGVICILLSICLDGMDGKLARYLNTESHFGATLDTLADFASFGIAPPILIYCNFLRSNTSMMDPLGSLYWLGAVFFVICMSLRLARFTATPAKNMLFFIGVPAPAGALLVLTPVYITLSKICTVSTEFYFASLILIGYLLISRIPTFAINKIRIAQDWMPSFSLFLTMFISFLFVMPWYGVLLINLLYLCTFPISIKNYKKLQ